MANKEELAKALAACENNEIDIVRSKECGCFVCQSIFSAREVSDWNNENGKSSAVCPYCGSASVVPDTAVGKLAPSFLKRLFVYARKTLPEDFFHSSAIRFCRSYLSNGITHNSHTDATFAAYALSLWAVHKESEFISPLLRIMISQSDNDHTALNRALLIADDPSFDNDSEILCLRSILYGLYAGDQKEKTQEKKAFEAASRSLGLDSLFARCLVSDYYCEGIGVREDPHYAFLVLASVLPQTMMDFIWLTRDTVGDYCQYFLRLSTFFLDKSLPYYDPRSAVRYALLSRICLHEISPKATDKKDPLVNEVLSSLEEAVEAFHTKSGEIVLDEQTFYDTFVDYSANITPITFNVIEYNAAEKTLTVEVGTGLPIPFIDCSAVYAGHVDEEKRRFVFNGVSSYRFDQSMNFFQYVVFGDGEWTFYLSSSAGSAEIGSILFEEDDDEEE